MTTHHAIDTGMPRRTMVTGLAWSLPVMLVGTQAPTFAASACPEGACPTLTAGFVTRAHRTQSTSENTFIFHVGGTVTGQPHPDSRGNQCLTIPQGVSYIYSFDLGTGQTGTLSATLPKDNANMWDVSVRNAQTQFPELHVKARSDIRTSQGISEFMLVTITVTYTSMARMAAPVVNATAHVDKATTHSVAGPMHHIQIAPDGTITSSL